MVGFFGIDSKKNGAGGRVEKVEHGPYLAVSAELGKFSDYRIGFYEV